MGRLVYFTNLPEVSLFDPIICMKQGGETTATTGCNAAIDKITAQHCEDCRGTTRACGDGPWKIDMEHEKH